MRIDKNIKILIVILSILALPFLWWIFLVVKMPFNTGLGKPYSYEYYHKLSGKLFAYNDKGEIIGFKLFGHWWQLQKDIKPSEKFNYSDDDIDSYSDISPYGDVTYHDTLNSHSNTVDAK